MIVYFANRKLDILGLASTHLKKGFYIIDDNRTEDVKSASSTFEFVVVFTDETRRELETMCEAGNYILCEDDNQEFYTIIDEEINVSKHEIKLYCEDAGLDLINTILDPFTTNEPQSFDYYLDAFVSDDGFEIGTNELGTDLKLTLEWTNSQTAKERILDLCTKFNDAEVSFSFKIEGLTIAHKYINIHKKRGQNNEETLRLGKEIDDITIKKSVSNLATALYVTGGQDDEGNTITLNGMRYDDGDFYVDGLYLRSRKAVEDWNRYTNAETINTVGRDIIRTYTYETLIQQTLLDKAIEELKKVRVPEVTYTANVISLPESIRVGDRINVVDEKGELYLSSRILNLQKSVTAQRYSVTLGEYKLRSSGISETVKKLAEDFKKYVEKNPVYIWIVYADDEQGTGITLDSTDKNYIGIYHTREGSEPDLTKPELYSWSRIRGRDGSRGVDGSTIWIANAEPTEDQTGLIFTFNKSDFVAQTGKNVLVGDVVFAGDYRYLVTAVDATTAETTNKEQLKGETGADGYSPTVSIDSSTPGQSTITITDKTGDHSATVMDGEDGKAYYGYCYTSSSAAAKVIELTDTEFELYSGVTLVVKFIAGNTSPTMTLNIENTGAKNVKVNDATNVKGKLDIPANTTVTFTYDGTNFTYTSSDNLLNTIQWTEETGLNIHADANSNSRVNITTDSVDIYTASGELGSRTDATGMVIYDKNNQAARFGKISTIGKEGQNRTIFGNDSFVMVDQYNKELLNISAIYYPSSSSNKITEISPTGIYKGSEHEDFDYTLKRSPNTGSIIVVEWWCYDSNDLIVWQERASVEAGTPISIGFADVDQYGHDIQTGTVTYDGDKTFTVDVVYSQYLQTIGTYDFRFTYTTSDAGYAPKITVYLRAVDELYQKIDALGWTDEVME